MNPEHTTSESNRRRTQQRNCRGGGLKVRVWCSEAWRRMCFKREEISSPLCSAVKVIKGRGEK